MDAVTPKLLFAGVVPAVCDAEAGPEHVIDAEHVIALRLEHPQDPPPQGGALNCCFADSV